MLSSLIFNSWAQTSLLLQHPKKLEQVVQWCLTFRGLSKDGLKNEELFLRFHVCSAVLREIHYSSDHKCPCVRGLVARALWVRGGGRG